GAGLAYYRSTNVRSIRQGATLTRTGVHARRIALVATTCASCGSVRVYWGSTLLRTIDLRSATRVNRKVIPVATFASLRSGTLSIRVGSKNAPVIVDGMVLRRD